MKIEREVLYSIVTEEGARIEVSEAELKQLFEELKKLFDPKIAAPNWQYCITNF